VVIQGAGGTGSPHQNTVQVRLFHNEVVGQPEQAIVLSDGRVGNQVEAVDDSQAFVRTDGDLLR